MAEIINQNIGEEGKKRGYLTGIILAIIVVTLIVAGYFVYRCGDECEVAKNEEVAPIVGTLDYEIPFGVFLTLPIEPEIKLEDSTLANYETGEEIRTITYISDKSKGAVFNDFLNFFEGEGWNIDNMTESDFIYASNENESFSILIEMNLAGEVRVTISHTRI